MQPLHSIMHHNHALRHVLEGLCGGAVQSLAGRPARTHVPNTRRAQAARTVGLRSVGLRHAGQVQGKPWAPLTLWASFRSYAETQLLTRTRAFAPQRAARARSAQDIGLIHGLGHRGAEVKALRLGVVGVGPAVGERDCGCAKQLLVDRAVAADVNPLLRVAEVRTRSTTQSSGYYVRRYREIYEELPYSTTLGFADRGSSIYNAGPEGFDVITPDPQTVDEPDISNAAGRKRGHAWMPPSQ